MPAFAMFSGFSKAIWMRASTFIGRFFEVLLEATLLFRLTNISCLAADKAVGCNYEVVEDMPPKLSKLELRILEALWAQERASIRDIQEAFPEPRPAYTTIQTIVYRMEVKHALRRVKRVGNADIFEPIVARDVTRIRVLDEVLSFFGGKAAPMIAQLADAGKLTPEDIQELEKTVRRLKAGRKERSK
jgi:BlaI family transcriptional regulator, penicillinase repressor